jgi:hypothetical protein
MLIVHRAFILPPGLLPTSALPIGSFVNHAALTRPPSISSRLSYYSPPTNQRRTLSKPVGLQATAARVDDNGTEGRMGH